MRYDHVFVISEVKMASHSVSRARCSEAISKPLVFISSLFVHFRLLVDGLCTHALVEFVEEECTGVVPLKRVIGDSFQAGDRVTVLWNDRKEYTAVFLYSGR